MNNNIKPDIFRPKIKSFNDIKTDGIFFQHIIKLVSEKINSVEEVTRISKKSIDIMEDNIPIPNSFKEEKYFEKTGILVGKVQSGKTINFTSLLSLAFDNGYKIGIILGGNTNDLLFQNSKRIREYFEQLKKEGKIVILDTAESWDVNDVKRYLDAGQKVIILTLKYAQNKNKQHMKRILQLFKNKWLNDIETMIIDDEGDQATLNSRRYEKISPESYIYKTAILIRNQLKKYCYISVTATPIANFLVKELDPLRPKFCSLIYHGKGYCGLSVFHGESKKKYIKIIPENEDSKEISNNDIWSEDAFEEALAAFYVGWEIRKARGDNGDHSMLVHTSQLKNNHELVETGIKMTLNSWILMAKSDVSDPNYFELIEILKKAYDDFVSYGVKTESFETLKNKILDSVKKGLTTSIINSENTQINKNAQIFIGGNKIARGVTISGLAVTYMTRRPKDKATLDSTEQRARWFGYKEKYLDVCRVWLTKRIKEDFENISNMETHYWNAIEEFNKSKKPFSEFELIFENQSDDHLVSTSKAKLEKFIIPKWASQSHFLNNESYVPLIRKYFENKDEKSYLNYGGNNFHTIYRSISAKEFKNEVLDKIKFSDKDTKFNSVVKELFDGPILQNSNELLDVVIMRERRKTEILRAINHDNTFKTVESGSNVNVKSDRQTAKESLDDRIQIQINFITPKNIDWKDKFESPVFYIHVPKKYQKKFDKGIKND